MPEKWLQWENAHELVNCKLLGNVTIFIIKKIGFLL